MTNICWHGDTPSFTRPAPLYGSRYGHLWAKIRQNLQWLKLAEDGDDPASARLANPTTVRSHLPPQWGFACSCGQYCFSTIGQYPFVHPDNPGAPIAEPHSRNGTRRLSCLRFVSLGSLLLSTLWGPAAFSLC